MCLVGLIFGVNLEANTFDTFKVEPSLMTVFEQSHPWDELIRHFVDSYVVETDKKAVCAFYNRGYIAEKLKGLETELSLECRITLNGEERWVRNVVIRGEIEDSESVSYTHLIPRPCRMACGIFISCGTVCISVN